MTEKIIDFKAPWGETFKNAVVKVGRYQDESIALTVHSDIGEPITTASLNLSSYGLYPSLGCIFVGSYSQHKGILKALTEAGILNPTGRVVTFGSISPQPLEAEEAEVLRELLP